MHAPSPTSKPNLQLAGRTLLTGGFRIQNVDRNPGYALIFAYRTDEFGIGQQYAFVLADGEGLNSAQASAAEVAATHHAAKPVYIASNAGGRDTIKWDRFLSLFGGPVFSAAPLDPMFRDQFITLGKNTLPPGLKGRPDSLFEAYVKVALEFVMWSRVIQYGQERSFEARPDGLILRDDFAAIYDAKAARDGYDVNTTSTRQFGDYVREFGTRYRPFVPTFHSFIVVSTGFQQGGDALVERSKDLQADCGVPMAFLTAETLMDIIDMLSDFPAARGSIRWKRLALNAVIQPVHVQKEIDAIRKDRVVPAAPAGK